MNLDLIELFLKHENYKNAYEALQQIFDKPVLDIWIQNLLNIKKSLLFKVYVEEPSGYNPNYALIIGCNESKKLIYTIDLAPITDNVYIITNFIHYYLSKDVKITSDMKEYQLKNYAKFLTYGDLKDHWEKERHKL